MDSIITDSSFDNIKQSLDLEVSKRQVLMIAYYFPPMGLSGVQRTLKFVKYLPEYNWNPIILTTGSTKYYAFDDTLMQDVGENVKIYRTEYDPFNKKNKEDNKQVKYPSRFKQVLFRILSQSVYIPDSRIKWKKHALKLGSKIIEENPDIKVIYATAPPYTDFLVAKELSLKYNIPFVIDYRDLWLDNPYFYFVTPYHKNKAVSLETSVLRYSQKAFVITRELKEKMLKRYNFLSHNDLRILPHGFDEEDFIPYKNIKPVPNQFTLTHSGVFSDDITPKYFLKAVAKFLEKNEEARRYINLKFVGLMRQQHIKLIDKLKLTPYTTLLDYIPHNEVIKHLMGANVLWMMIPNDIATPSRFYEYMGARRNLLVCAPEGGIRNIAKEYNAALICGPKNVTEITAAIEKFYNMWKNNNMLVPNEKFVQQFDRHRITSILAKELSLASRM